MEMKRERMRYMRPAAVWLLGTAMLALAGCVKRDLEIRPDEGCVEIVLDWTKAGGSSRSARLLFYNESGTLVKEVSGVTDCFKGTFPLGNYRLLVHNTDAVRVDWRGTERYESAEVFALPAQYGTDYHPERVFRAFRSLARFLPRGDATSLKRWRCVRSKRRG